MKDLLLDWNKTYVIKLLVKHLSKEQNPETKVDIVDEAVEIIEMDNVIDQGEFMQDPDFAERQDKDEDEPKPGK